MKVLRLISSHPKPHFVEEDVPRPQPQPGEVVVRVCAVAVTPTELLWHPTSYTKDGSPRNAPVLGHEFSGEIAECGASVSEVSVGQEVYGMNDWYAEGALAEYCVTRPEWIADKPQRLSHEEAATVPISALTAWQGLFERGGLQRGEPVLIHGGAGAVGMFAVQLARIRKARVTTTVSAKDIEFVRTLGADEALDYRAMPFEDLVRKFDLILDTVGGETLRRSWQVLSPNGRLVTVAAESEFEIDQRVKQSFFIVEPNRTQLAEVGRLLGEGSLQTPVARILPTSAATDAYAESIKKLGRGKLAISTRRWS